jgi:hypothetical protein
MKFKVTMKDPDTLYDAIGEAVEQAVSDTIGVDDNDEREALIKVRVDKVQKICGKWFEYGEYLTVEIDTDAETCTVVTP